MLLLFCVAYAYQLKQCGVAEVILWVRASVQGYDHVRIADMTTSFMDGGFALSALLHR